ncbi:cell division protein SepF [bacterium]|nr:cell division protein SepF [bacterium]
MLGKWLGKVRTFFSASDEYRVHGDSAGDSATRVTEVSHSVTDVPHSVGERRRGVAAVAKSRTPMAEIIFVKDEDYKSEEDMTNAVAEALKNNKSVIANMEQSSTAAINQTVYFCAGMMFMVDGQTIKLTKRMYMFATNDFLVTYSDPRAEAERIYDDYMDSQNSYGSDSPKRVRSSGGYR